MTKNHIFIIILTWNNYEDTKECIESLIRISCPAFSIVVVDNASNDGSIDKIKVEFPYLNYLQLKENVGISGGYNAGIKFAINHNANLIIVSNNDIVFSESALLELLNASENNANAGILVPKTLNYYNHSHLAGIGGVWRVFPPGVKMIGWGTPNKDKFSNEQFLEFAISSCYLVTKNLIEKIGYFDTGYFFYNDDWDFSIRARKAGFRIKLIPEAIVYHKVSLSTQKGDKKEVWWRYFGRSTVRFYSQHRNRAELIIFILWFCVRETLKGKLNRIGPFLKGVKVEIEKINSNAYR